MASQCPQTADALQVHDLVEELADQLCPAVDGEFNFLVKVTEHEESIDKLQMLINLVLNSADLAMKRANSKNEELVRALALAENQQRALDEHAIVSITDVKGDIIFVNDKFCEISGYSRKELLGQNHRMVKSQEHSLEFYRDLWKTISHGVAWSGEIKNRRKDGSFYWVAATIVPFKDDNGTIVKYVAIRTDISPLRFAEDRLQASNTELKEFNDTVVDRELRMIELKEEINSLVVELGHSARYDVSCTDQGHDTLAHS